MDKKKPGSLEKNSEKKLFLRGEILYRFGEKILFFYPEPFVPFSKFSSLLKKACFRRALGGGEVVEKQQ